VKVRKRGSDTNSARDSYGHRKQEDLTSRKLDERAFGAVSGPIKTNPSGNEPAYRRAEMILQSLAQTGQRLTKKNREIEHLLKEQDRRIRKCRKNEDNIHALLS